MLSPDVSTRVDQYRRENPNEFRAWEAAHGCVIQFWGFRMYYGSCPDCEALVTARRAISHRKVGQTMIGRWVEYCDSCRLARREADNDKARGRMRRLRARRKLEHAQRVERQRRGGSFPWEAA